jgi:DNA-binding GntR family transcriptional regulator
MIKAQKLSEQVYQHLLRMILAGDLAPGSPLREPDLAARLGVSRTPIREALGRLAEYGVVEAEPNHTSIVRRLGPDELGHFHQAREALEGMAAELACGRLSAADYAQLDALADATRDQDAPGYWAAFNAFDIGLHRLVAERSGNPILAREIVKLHGLTLLIHEQLESVLIGAGRLDAAERFEIRRINNDQHMEIINALRSGTPEACRRSMIDHIRSSCQRKVGIMPAATPQVIPATSNGRRPARTSPP